MGEFSKKVSLIILLIVFILQTVFGFIELPCTSPDDYKFGQILSVSYTQEVKTNSWMTISIKVKNNGNCKTMYRAYAEVPTDLISRYSFPDYFWLNPGESKTVSLQLYTGGLTGSGDITVKLQSHYATFTYLVDSKTLPITISAESPSLEEQTKQTAEALQNELEEETKKLQEALTDAIAATSTSFSNSPLSKLSGVHLALHFVGENAAQEDMQAAIEAQRHEIKISENVADAITIAIGHAFTPAAGAGQAVVQAVCGFSHFRGTPLEETRNIVTKMLLKNDIVSDRYVGEEMNSYISVYLGGPIANKKMVFVNNRMKELSLPYFQGNKLVAPDGEIYGWGYGVYAIIPDVDPVQINPDGTFTINIGEINERIRNGKTRLYFVVASGTDRRGTIAAEKAYLETLAVTEEMTEVIKKGLCAGDLSQDDLYLLGNVLSGYARRHAITALENPEILDISIEFTKSIILLGSDKHDKNIKIRPVAIVVKAVGDNWAPVRIYYGN